MTWPPLIKIPLAKASPTGNVISHTKSSPKGNKGALNVPITKTLNTSHPNLKVQINPAIKKNPINDNPEYIT